MVIDKKIVKQRFEKNILTYNNHAHIQKEICKKLTAKLLNIKDKQLNRILEIGCGTGFLTEELLKNISPDYFYANDIVESTEKYISKILNSHHIKNQYFICGDAETLDFPKDLDLIISTSTIQWFVNLNKFINNTVNSLKKGGIFAFSTFGPKNFLEIRSISDSGLNYLPIKEYKELLGSEFTIHYSEEYTNTIHFNNAVEVLKHIKYTGVNGNNKFAWTKKELRYFTDKYDDMFFDGEGVPLTYHPIILIAEKK